MSHNLQSPSIEITAAPGLEHEEDVTSGTRTPRPYHHDGIEIQQDENNERHDHKAPNCALASSTELDETVEEGQWTEYSGQASVEGSESGTEADDERPKFLKALTAPHVRPRKGLRAGEASEDVLLTPSQLDDEGRRLSQDYFKHVSRDKVVSEDEEKEEQQKLLRRRIAEFARRCSEVGLMTGIAICVLCGQDVFRTAYLWRHELMSHVAIITALILAYPVKLSIVDNTATATKLWQRFRVPASFDPATVLYPTFLPVLVALSLSPGNCAVVLPNIILGLSSLPQRLFPRSSRIGAINVVHWFASIVPLILAGTTGWPMEKRSARPCLLRCTPSTGIRPEMLITLYPLHHALLQPLQYLTTTSLLVTELHLLSATLINLLILADSPQTTVLQTCLWLGGLLLFIACRAVLHWNVVLMRIPKWKFRRPGSTAEERKSLVDAVSDLVSLQRAAAAFAPADVIESDADEDESTQSTKHQLNGQPPASRLSFHTILFDSLTKTSTKPEVESKPTANGPDSGLRTTDRPRRSTLPVRDPPPIVSSRERSKRRKEGPSNLLWCLHLTPAQAQRRKWLYATYTYLTIVAVIIGPVRYYVSENALKSQEPVGWAVGYLLGQLRPVQVLVGFFALGSWISIPNEAPATPGIGLTFPLDIPAMRDIVGQANTRVILIAYWAFVLLSGLLAVFSLTAFVEVDTRRKVFHGVMVAMIVPTAFVDPCAVAFALILILAVFLLLEIIRAGQLIPLGNAISKFVAPYVDGRDLRGPVVVSHLFLLIGCAVPLWFSLASIQRTGSAPWTNWELVDDKREVAMVAGVICVGMGDAAASLIGRRYGRRKWIWVGGKSLEGSAAFAVAVTVGLMVAKAWLVMGGWADTTGSNSRHRGAMSVVQCVLAWHVILVKAMFCACGASFMEAVLTGANDNVVVPVALWLLVKGVRL